MNLVSLLIVPAVVQLSIGSGANAAVRALIAIIALAIIVAAVWNSKRKSIAVSDSNSDSGTTGTGTPVTGQGTAVEGVASAPGAPRSGDEDTTMEASAQSI